VLLEENHDKYNQLNHHRSVKEQNLLGVRDEYKNIQIQQNNEKKKGEIIFPLLCIPESSQI